MALPPLASDSDLETWLGHEVDVPRAQAILHASSTLIRSHTGRVWVEEDGGLEEGVTELQMASVRNVTLSVSARVYDNPHGRSQKATGPFSWSVAAWSALGLALSGEEKAQLPGPPGAVNGLSSVRVQAPWDARGTKGHHL